MKRLITLIVGVLCTAPWSVRAQFDDAAAAQLQKLVQAYRYVDAAYVDSLDTAPLVEEAIRGMLMRLDPHSAYLSEEEMKGVDESFDGSFGGIGIEFNVLNDTVVIVNTIAGGPSAQVGLLPGDRIVGIDGQRAVGLSRAEVPKRLRGPSGTQVRLEVSRHAVKEPLAFTVTRGDIPLHTVDAAYKVDAETGYIKVNRFGRTTMQEFVEAFKGMKGVRSLILDLRGNGGGLREQAVAMANFCLSRGSRFVSTVGRAVPSRAYTAPFPAGRSWCSSTRTRLRPARSSPGRCRTGTGRWSSVVRASARGWCNVSSGWATARRSASRWRVITPLRGGLFSDPMRRDTARSIMPRTASG